MHHKNTDEASSKLNQNCKSERNFQRSGGLHSAVLDRTLPLILPMSDSMGLHRTGSGYREAAKAGREPKRVGLRGRDARTIALGMVATVSLGASLGAVAEEVVRHFNIQEKPLAQALMDLGMQSGLTVVAPTALTEGKKGAQIRGDMSAEDALRHLLRGSGLTFIRWEDGTIAIQAQTAALRFGSEGAGQTNDGGDGSMEDSTEQVRLEEIVVTAQKRTERLQDVPMAVSVLSGQDLDRSTEQGITEALNRVPGMVTLMVSQGGTSQLAVRGVASGGALFQGSSPIAYYLDSVPFALVRTALTPDANAYDLDRVEVLRGPQGTLYGASTLNGVVRVLTKDANLNDFEFKARTSASSTERGGENYRGDFAANVPLIEGKLAARAVVGYQNLSGWIDRANAKDANEAEIRNFRLKVNAQPTEQLSVGLSAWLSRTDYGAPSSSADGTFNTHLLNEPISDDFDAYGLKIGYEFSHLSVTSMTSYLDYANRGMLDYTAEYGAPLLTYLPATVFSQEILLNSKLDSPWRWSAGVFYRDAEDASFQILSLPQYGYNYPLDQSDASESSAVFAEIGRRFMQDRWEWSVGLRYFQDDVTVREAAILTEVLPEPFSETDSVSATTPRAVLTWHANDDLTVYGSYAQGFRSGIRQDLLVLLQNPDFPPVRPDKLTNYEIGMKGNVWDRRIAFETALYYIDWQDVQQQLSVPFGNSVVAAPINGNSASGIGVDFSVTAQPVDGLVLGLNFSWNDLAEDSPVFSSNQLFFDEGERLANSPEYTAGASVDYVFPLGAGGFKGRLSASANYVSALQGVTAPTADTPRVLHTGDSMLLGRASFAVEALDHWTASLFVDNVSDEQGVQRPELINDFTIRVRPRTIGLQLEYRYGK